MSGVQSPRARADLLAAGASIKGAARKFAIDYHALRRHWRNHVSAEARAAYIAGVGATKDQLEEIVADETLALIDHYRIVRGALYKGFGAASELGDGNSLALLAGRLHENFRDCGRLTGELQRGPLLRSAAGSVSTTTSRSASITTACRINCSARRSRRASPPRQSRSFIAANGSPAIAAACARIGRVLSPSTCPPPTGAYYPQK